jgi:hypothetical protein
VIANSAGSRAQKKIALLVSSGIDGFWRELQSLLKLRRYYSDLESHSFYSLTLNGNIITAFHILIGGIFSSIPAFIYERSKRICTRS